MGGESHLVLRIFAHERGHPIRVRIELMSIKNLEIGSLDFPQRDTIKFTHRLTRRRERQPSALFLLPCREAATLLGL